MCGMRSMRRNGSTGLCASGGNFVGNFERRFVHRAASRMAFRITSGLCTVPPACGTGNRSWPCPRRRVPLRAPSGPGSARAPRTPSPCRPVRGCARPGRATPRSAGTCPRLHALLARQFDGALRHARSDAVGDHHHFGVFQVGRFEQRPARRPAASACPAGGAPAVLRLHVHAGVAALVVRQAGDVEAVAVARLHHVGHQVRAGLEQAEILRRRFA